MIRPRHFQRPLTIPLHKQLLRHVAGPLLASLAWGVVPCACGASADSSTVTETGNPPFLEKQQLTVRQEDDRVVVQGAKGAVPEGVELTLVNEATGDEVTGTSSADGSFELTVKAEEGDSLTLQVKTETNEKTFNIRKAQAVDCDGLLSQSEQAMRSKLEEAASSCVVAADCTLFSDAPCTGTCSPWSVSTTEQADLQDEFDRILGSTCVEFETASCEAAEEFCITVHADCVEGQCVVAEGEADTNLDRCEQLEQAAREPERLLDTLPRDCSGDFDCVLASPNTCMFSCNLWPVNVAAHEELDTVKARMETDICPQLTECDAADDDCPTIVGPAAAWCIEGQCQATYQDESWVVCGGELGETCAEDEYCAHPHDRCEAPDATAFCRPRPDTCSREGLPVCGCDQKDYGNPCEAAMNGVSTWKLGSCEDALAR